MNEMQQLVVQYYSSVRPIYSIPLFLLRRSSLTFCRFRTLEGVVFYVQFLANLKAWFHAGGGKRPEHSVSSIIDNAIFFSKIEARERESNRITLIFNKDRI